jgi:hypothetical protein
LLGVDIVVVSHRPGHFKVSPFAPTPEQGASRWAPIIANRNSAGSPWAMFLNYIHPKVGVGERRVDLGRL